MVGSVITELQAPSNTSRPVAGAACIGHPRVTISNGRLEQLERVTVQNKVDGAASVPVDGLEEYGELRRPSEILGWVPSAGGSSPDAHVHVADDDDGA